MIRLEHCSHLCIFSYGSIYASMLFGWWILLGLDLTVHSNNNIALGLDNKSHRYCLNC